MKGVKEALLGRKGIIAIILICMSALIFWYGSFEFGKYYSKNSRVNATNPINKIKKIVKTKVKPEEKDNVAKGMEVYKLADAKPGFVEPWENQKNSTKKIAYLTIDDGPSINTRKILNILKENNINATFFLIGQNAERYPELVKEEVAEGNSVANHTYSHPLNYKRYTPEEFIGEIEKCDKILKNILGDKYIPKFMRFPGGLYENTPSLKRTMEPYKQAVENDGYRFINWNVLTGDADRYLEPVNYLTSNVKKESYGKNVVVILMHDAAAKTTTVQALPEIIQYLRSQGYTFGVLKK
ncbi:polysaccharide deacetylase family protein [Clostridium hydrogenum]|uniref:polysaccharide deacetylase family protein n=1 Tax=Clostridium hydrogenum TaxID=2855764 RepID=UPI001F3674A7|nr:polysaccharide deacetylase family protein [Clostridium hydrogenum]